jgi:hypothetical protein
MIKTELNEPSQIADIEKRLRDTHIITAPAKVMIGEHPEHGSVVLITTSEGAVLLADGVRSVQHRTDPGPHSTQVSGR